MLDEHKYRTKHNVLPKYIYIVPQTRVDIKYLVNCDWIHCELATLKYMRYKNGVCASDAWRESQLLRPQNLQRLSMTVHLGTRKSRTIPSCNARDPQITLAVSSVTRTSVQSSMTHVWNVSEPPYRGTVNPSLHSLHVLEWEASQEASSKC